MKTVALRRLKDAEMKRARSDVEVAVALSETERERYESIRSKSQKTMTEAGKAVATHELLSRILQMRRICSHGLYEQVVRPGTPAAREALSGITKCSEGLPTSLLDLHSQFSWTESGESTYRASHVEEDGTTPSLTPDSISILSEQQEMIGTAFQMSFDATNASEDNDIDMDLHGINLPGIGSSSKVESVVDNLVQLQQMRHTDSKPIKR